MPFTFWKNAITLTELATDAQSVVTMRMAGMMGLYPVSDTENTRMVDEKIEAMGQSQMAALRGAMTGQTPDQILAAALEPIHSKARENSKRLSAGGSTKES